MYTDKQIKTAIVYNERLGNMTPDEQFKHDAYSALWDRIISTYINDEDLSPINPSHQ